MAGQTLDSTAALMANDAIAPLSYPVCRITYSRDTWVQLFHPPSDYAGEEAKLLCQGAGTTWIAWVPGHGEVILDRSHFYSV
jgi:hypothetical protein